ncbi:type I-C CRISPR-associated endonuclease Cas1c [Catenisphaera adipataccumulans]|jgi:CRISPR-associated protein Cas1|uniref:CRISPR-associated endonuclease Cas1 n=1 Tax=Catenisphaera adipataccumulans TaxID=700500 RepID=A0A7W8D1R0_9FIRM|nr:type I-C CRISPR-associated endonuclease Cas1c [Catenisphaera adipataccumulans]MBB5183950.1 CRISPR-associated protein Cas1 [Catenisphaera adipataccumulans]
MRKLQNTLYITTDCYLHLDGENVVVSKDGDIVGRVPLHNLESIVTTGYTGASPALMGACAQKNIDLCFLSRSGKFLARIVGETKGNVILRQEQYKKFTDSEFSISVSKNMIRGKIYNSRWILERYTRDAPLRVNVSRLKEKSKMIAEIFMKIDQVTSANQLLGIEGSAAKNYFSVFGELILNQKNTFQFVERNRRPPLDPTNALLSFCYSLLCTMCMSAIECCGLDPYIGVYHVERPGRPSLALDLMEELRPVMVDRFVLNLINTRRLKAKDFLKKEDGAVLLTDEGRKKLFLSWQNRKKEEIQHPYLKQKVPWGLIPYVQAKLLASYVREDLDGYPPFFWK